MTRCPTQDELVRFVDGSLSPEESQRIDTHAPTCESCRDTVRALQRVIADLKAPVGTEVDIQAHTRAVMKRLNRADVVGPANAAGVKWRRGRLLAGAVTIAACGVLVATRLLPHSPRAVDRWQVRGGHARATIGRDVGVQPYTARAGLSALTSGAAIDTSTPLTASYRNLGDTPAFLLLFAVDDRRVVHWISPAFTRPEDNPVSTTLPASVRERMLDTTVVLDSVSPGPLRIVAVLTSTPAHVSDIESLEETDLSATRIARHVPDAEIRETIVNVHDATGDAR